MDIGVDEAIKEIVAKNMKEVGVVWSLRDSIIKDIKDLTGWEISDITHYDHPQILKLRCVDNYKNSIRVISVKILPDPKPLGPIKLVMPSEDKNSYLRTYWMKDIKIKPECPIKNFILNHGF